MIQKFLSCKVVSFHSLSVCNKLNADFAGKIESNVTWWRPLRFSANLLKNKVEPVSFMA